LCFHVVNPLKADELPGQLAPGAAIVRVVRGGIRIKEIFCEKKRSSLTPILPNDAERQAGIDIGLPLGVVVPFARVLQFLQTLLFEILSN